MTPLIDVMLVLLMIFMIAAPLMSFESLEIELPKVAARDRRRQRRDMAVDHAARPTARCTLSATASSRGTTWCARLEQNKGTPTPARRAAARRPERALRPRGRAAQPGAGSRPAHIDSSRSRRSSAPARRIARTRPGGPPPCRASGSQAPRQVRRDCLSTNALSAPAACPHPRDLRVARHERRRARRVPPGAGRAARRPSWCPTVVGAVVMIAGFVGWDLMRDPGHLGPVAATRLGGAALVLVLLAIVRRVLLPLSFRGQALVMYCAIYAMQAADRRGARRRLAAADAGPADRDVLRRDRACRAPPTRWSTWPLAAMSVPLVLPAGRSRPTWSTTWRTSLRSWRWCGRRARCWSACRRRASPTAAACNREASTDALTGLSNRRGLESGMVREMERARRMQRAAVAGDHRHRLLQAHQRPARPRHRRRRAARGGAHTLQPATSARATCSRASAARSSRW